MRGHGRTRDATRADNSLFDPFFCFLLMSCKPFDGSLATLGGRRRGEGQAVLAAVRRHVVRSRARPQTSTVASNEKQTALEIKNRSNHLPMAPTTASLLFLALGKYRDTPLKAGGYAAQRCLAARRGRAAIQETFCTIVWLAPTLPPSRLPSHHTAVASVTAEYCGTCR